MPSNARLMKLSRPLAALALLVALFALAFAQERHTLNQNANVNAANNSTVHGSPSPSPTSRRRR